MAEKKKKNQADELNELDEAYYQLAGSKKAASKRRHLVTVCIALAVVLLGVGCFLIACFGSWFDSFLPMGNVTVGSTSLRGMTKQEAKQALTAMQREYAEKPMVIRVLDNSVELTGAEAKLVFDVNEAVNAAFRQPNCVNLELLPYLEMDTDAVKAAVDQLGAIFNTTFKESVWTVNGSAPSLSPEVEEQPGKHLVIKKGVPQYGLDTEALYQLVLAGYNTYQFQVVGECSALEPDLPDLEAILQEHYVAPVNASMDSKTFIIQQESYGYGFDLEEAAAKLAALPYGQTVSIPFSRIPAEVTQEDLLATLYTDVLGEFQTPYVGEDDNNRNTNLALACAAINDVILLPGEEFSYNNALGERTADAGYKPAGTYVNGLTVDTIGGGICQVSSTLYYCTLLADLKIIERWPHGYISNYTDPGMDASVSWPNADLHFANNTGYPIKIVAYRADGNVTVKILGTETKDYYVEMHYKIINTEPYETVYEEYPPDNPKKYHDGQVLVSPYTGYKVLAYKHKYSKADGSLLSNELESTNEYKRRDLVIVKIVDTPATTPEDTPAE